MILCQHTCLILWQKVGGCIQPEHRIFDQGQPSNGPGTAIASVSTAVSTVVSTVPEVLAFSNLMEASVMAVIPALALATPRHLGVPDHFLTHRVTIEVRFGLGAWSWWHALRIFGSGVAVTTVAVSSVAAISAVPSVAVVSSIVAGRVVIRRAV